MARLRYWINTSLDGYIADTAGRFDWSEPDTELHEFFNEQERQVGVHLYGRRLYELMSYRETAELLGDRARAARPTPAQADYARIWQVCEKVVYSRTLTQVHTRRTELVRESAADDVARRKASADQDLSVGGAELPPSCCARDWSMRSR